MKPSFLGIDYGTKRIGLAIATTPIAEPLKILKQETAIPQIKQICDDHKITQIILGISESDMAKQTKAFAQLLKKALKLPITFQNETLSSREVHQKLQKSKARPQPIT